MQLSRATQYAILAMAQLKTDGPPVSSTKLAALGNMPPRFLLQVMRNLAMSGLVKAKRGVDGGYNLARNSAEISVYEIAQAIDGPAYAPDSTLLRALSKSAHNAVLRAMENSTTDAVSYLSKVRLSELSLA